MIMSGPGSSATTDDQPNRAWVNILALTAMTRPSHILFIVILFGNGILLGAWRSGSLDDTDWISVWLALGLLILLSMSVHLANEAVDHETDRLTLRTPFSGGSGALEWSGLTPRTPLAISLILAALVVVMTIPLLAASLMEPAAGLFIILGLAGGLAYSLPPISAMRRGFGEPLNALLGGMLPLLGVAASIGTVQIVDVVAFLPFTLVVFASVLATAWPDRAADGATGKRTMQVRLAPITLRLVAAATFVGFLLATGLAASSDAMPYPLAGLIVVPLLLIALRRYTRATSPIFSVMAMAGHALITTAVLIVSQFASSGSAS